MLSYPVTPPLQKMADVANDQQLIDLWLHDKSSKTQRAYSNDIECFLEFIELKSLQTVTLNDVQAFATALSKQGKALATQNRRLSALKSLLSFGYELGYLTFNVGNRLKTPKVKNTLAERIMNEMETMTLIALEPNFRNKLLLSFLYYSAARVSEVGGLTWRDLKAVGSRGQVTLHGKGQETRVVGLPTDLYQQLLKLRGSARADEPVFVSRKQGKGLQVRQIRKIVKDAGNRAGIENVSPHWFRHSHASHALNRGAAPQLVQVTLGHASLVTTSRYAHAIPSDSSALYLPGSS